MTLIERFVAVQDWPTSRKTLLLAALTVPFHLISTESARFAFARTGTVDVELFRGVCMIGLAAMLFCLLSGALGTLLRREWRWTAYAVAVTYGLFVAALLHALGTWSTPVLAVWPVVTILAGVWFDARLGWFAFAYGVVLATLVRILESSGTLPYAPALLDRSIDAQQSAWWFTGNILLVAQYFIFSFALSMLVVSARRMQDDHLHEAQQKLELSNRLISRYVPNQLAERILSGAHTETLRPVRAKLTVFFSDVDGFTDASDRLEPEELEAVLNEYLSAMMEIADAHGATTNQIVGDGIMIFFGAPQATSDRDHALRAVRMARQMQARMVELADTWQERGVEKPFRIRIGINTGYASVGDYGSKGRTLYSAIGLQTNLAARIQAHCRPGGILISHSTWALVHDEIRCVESGELDLKGVHYPVRVYEVTEPTSKVLPFARAAS